MSLGLYFLLIVQPMVRRSGEGSASDLERQRPATQTDEFSSPPKGVVTLTAGRPRSLGLRYLAMLCHKWQGEAYSANILPIMAE